MKPDFVQNCPINEQTADGDTVGRCWHFMTDGHTCPRHGDVTVEVKQYAKTGYLTLESTMRLRRSRLLAQIKEVKHV